MDIIISTSESFSSKIAEILAGVKSSYNLNILMLKGATEVDTFLSGESYENIALFFVEIQNEDEISQLERLQKHFPNGKFIVFVDQAAMKKKLISYMMFENWCVVNKSFESDLAEFILRVVEFVFEKADQVSCLKSWREDWLDIILFIEVSKIYHNCLRFIFKMGEKIVRSPLNALDLMGTDLVYSDRSTIINLRNVAKLDEKLGLIYFKNSDEIAYVSRRRKKKIKDLLGNK